MKIAKQLLLDDLEREEEKIEQTRQRSNPTVFTLRLINIHLSSFPHSPISLCPLLSPAPSSLALTPLFPNYPFIYIDYINF